MRKKRIPSYRLHKPSGQAIVTLPPEHRVHYLGPYDSPVSRQEYDRLIAEWLANGRAVEPSPEHEPDPRDTITVVEVIEGYWDHCQVYFGDESNRQSETYNLKPILRLLRQTYGDDAVKDFDTLKLEAIRQSLIQKGNTRPTVNKQIDRVRRMFKWAAGKKLVRSIVHAELMTLERLKKGRSEAAEGRHIPPVAFEVVSATLPLLSDVVADMVRFELITGARPAEVCIIRPCDIDRDGEVWEYYPSQHKNDYRGRTRIIPLGPLAQEVITKYLLRDHECPCFTPVGKPTGSKYTTGSYRRAVQREIDRHNANTDEPIERWSPNQLRKARATEIRRLFGLEAAKATLGHGSSVVTDRHYAEEDLQLMRKVAAETG